MVEQPYLGDFIPQKTACVVSGDQTYMLQDTGEHLLRIKRVARKLQGPDGKTGRSSAVEAGQPGFKHLFYAMWDS